MRYRQARTWTFTSWAAVTRSSACACRLENARRVAVAPDVGLLNYTSAGLGAGLVRVTGKMWCVSMLRQTKYWEGVVA